MTPQRASTINDLQSQAPPQDLQAEISVLGSVLLDNRAMDAIEGIIKPHMFYVQAHQEIFAVCAAQYAKREAFDVVTIASALNASGKLDEIGGPPYLGDILAAVPHAVHAKYYAELVRNTHVRRQVIYNAIEAMTVARDETLEIDELISKIEAGVSAIAEAQVGTGTNIVRDVLVDAMEFLTSGRVDGLKTGFLDLDSLIYGFVPGNLVILAARPAMGKTAFALNLAANVCSAGKSVLVVSLEMGNLEVVNRLLSIAGDIPAEVTKRQPTEYECQQILGTAAKIEKWDLVIDDGVDRTVARIAARSRIQKRKSGLDLLIIDYLQLITPEDSRIPREQQVSAMTRQLKNLARSLGVPVIVLAQLNRALENRPDKRPKLSDLRESGAIEQDADVVMFAHRPEYYDPEDSPGECEIIISKQRNGKTGTAKLYWKAETMQFKNAASMAYHEVTNF